MQFREIPGKPLKMRRYSGWKSRLKAAGAQFSL
jgi:hypothetical protein